MFIAMNRFRVQRGCEPDFEAVWLNREVFINREPGFVAFHLLKGPQTEEYSLYVSHTMWASTADFENLDSLRKLPRGAQECGRQQTALHRRPAIRGLRGHPGGETGVERGG